MPPLNKPCMETARGKRIGSVQETVEIEAIPSLLAMLHLLHSVINEEQCKKPSANISVTMENT